MHAEPGQPAEWLTMILVKHSATMPALERCSLTAIDSTETNVQGLAFQHPADAPQSSTGRSLEWALQR